MYVAITGNQSNQDVYLKQSYRKENGRTSSRIYKKLGKLNVLLAQFNGDLDALMTWARQEAQKETALYRQRNGCVSIDLSKGARIVLNEQRSFHAGYLFLQELCTELRLDKICRMIRNHYQFEYDFHAILTDLIYARILSPSSKRKSYEYCKTLLEAPTYSLQDVYRSLSVIASEADFLQSELYRNSNLIHKRNKRILYYDCTNFYFETEQESSIARYGKGKDHKPNPIVTLGLFMDADGIPLAFDVFPGNQNEQTTLKPLEQKVIQDFECSEFIFCSDSGLGSLNNRRFNSFQHRAYVITHSLKKMKQEDREIAMNPAQFRKLGSPKFIDLRSLDESDKEVFNSIYYKEVPVINGDMDETLIVTYSPKYAAYQRSIREKQIARARLILDSPGRKRKGKNQNDPMRFVKKISVTDSGEIAEKNVYDLDLDRIKEEQMYDGFYAVITNLDSDVSEIIRINRQRWEIEENFRIMKTDLEARPAFVRTEDHIRAHFLICYVSLMVYRLLEKKLDNAFTCQQLLNSLRSMDLTLLSSASGYIPSYTRTEVTDALHQCFGFRTDYEIMTKASVRSIIKSTKIFKSEEK